MVLVVEEMAAVQGWRVVVFVAVEVEVKKRWRCWLGGDKEVGWW